VRNSSFFAGLEIARPAAGKSGVAAARCVVGEASDQPDQGTFDYERRDQLGVADLACRGSGACSSSIAPQIRPNSFLLIRPAIRLLTRLIGGNTICPKCFSLSVDV
jgi:hypothetical protein